MSHDKIDIRKQVDMFFKNICKFKEHEAVRLPSYACKDCVTLFLEALTEALMEESSLLNTTTNKD